MYKLGQVALHAGKKVSFHLDGQKVQNKLECESDFVYKDKSMAMQYKFDANPIFYFISHSQVSNRGKKNYISFREKRVFDF